MTNRRGLMLASIMLLIVLTVGVLTGFKDGGDKAAVFSNLVIHRGEIVAGSAASVFGNMTVDGIVTGDVAAVFGNAEINGVVNGDVAAIFGSVKVGKNGVIHGNAVGIGGGVVKEPGAMIRGEVSNVKTGAKPFKLDRHNMMPNFTFGSVLWLALIYIVSAAAVAIIPERLMVMAEDSLNRVGRRFGIGLLAYLLIGPTMLLLIITLVGILLIPFAAILFGLTAFLGSVALKIGIGRRLIGNTNNKNSVYIYLLVGVILVYAITMVPIIGWLLYGILGVIGMGLIIDTRFGNLFRKRQG